jgi:hypothetical protein
MLLSGVQSIMNGPIAGLIIILVLFPAILAIDCISTEERAAEIIADLKAADDRQKQFEALQQTYGDKLKRGPECDSEYCLYEITVNNRPLAMLHLADPAEIVTTFQFLRGFLWLVNTEYRVHPTEGESVFVHVQEDYCSPNCSEPSHLGLHPHGRQSNEMWNALVMFNEKFAGEPRDAARALIFAVSCRSRSVETSPTCSPASGSIIPTVPCGPASARAATHTMTGSSGGEFRRQ